MHRKHLPVTILAIAASFLASCAASGTQAPRVLATTGMIGHLASTIAGDSLAVDVMMGPGVDPHLYKATARDLDRLGSASLILYNGLHLEARLGEVLEGLASRIPTVAVSAAMPEDRLLRAGGDTFDPHVWFDVALWSLAADSVHQALAAQWPEHAPDFARRHQALMDELSALDTEVRTALASIPPEARIMVTAHDAFNYFGRAYGLDVRGLQGISTNDEASTRDIQDLADFLATARVPALFVESSVSPRSIQALLAAVKDRGHPMALGGELFSDAMGSRGTVEGTYPGMVRHNVRTIVTALGGDPSLVQDSSHE